jgi:uncharacterized membrane protein YeaQ/YmgE (transglycosylase-associated protein family)
MNVLSWMLFGLLVGLVKNFTNQHATGREQLATLIFSVMGAVAGGLFAVVILDVSLQRFHVVSFGNAALGAILFLFMSRKLRRL